MRFRRLISSVFAISAISAACIGAPSQAVAAEKVSVAIISFSPYATWYIVKGRKLAQNIDLNLSQNLGAFGLPGGKPLCESLPEGAPRAPKSIGWGLLFDGRDCAAGYAGPTWDLFNELYIEAGVAKKKVKSSDGIDSRIVRKLGAEGYVKKSNSNKWIGRLGL